ncbi:pyridoxal 5'-phosphate synthase glutaminase subunit PdxT [bacterium]|nr:pyridoxal 5'-phosphate synthase glutaminase subunit PdxT [bacterium]
MTRIGVLSLQGCSGPHEKHLEKLGIDALRVRFPSELAEVDAIILPGGESSTMIKLLRINGLFDELARFVRERPTWGICAGSILLAQEVVNPTQPSFGATRIRAVRNAYGSQLYSKKSTVSIPQGKKMSSPYSFEVDFIRAPRFELLSDEVEVLATGEEGEPIMVRDRNTLCTSFHTELGEDSGLHEYFLREFVESVSS